jgi:hypothetical protein
MTSQHKGFQSVTHRGTWIFPLKVSQNYGRIISWVDLFRIGIKEEKDVKE